MAKEHRPTSEAFPIVSPNKLGEISHSRFLRQGALQKKVLKTGISKLSHSPIQQCGQLLQAIPSMSRSRKQEVEVLQSESAPKKSSHPSSEICAQLSKRKSYLPDCVKEEKQVFFAHRPCSPTIQKCPKSQKLDVFGFPISLCDGLKMSGIFKSKAGMSRTSSEECHHLSSTKQ